MLNYFCSTLYVNIKENVLNSVYIFYYCAKVYFMILQRKMHSIFSTSIFSNLGFVFVFDRHLMAIRFYLFPNKSNHIIHTSKYINLLYLFCVFKLFTNECNQLTWPYFFIFIFEQNQTNLCRQTFLFNLNAPAILSPFNSIVRLTANKFNQTANIRCTYVQHHHQHQCLKYW